MCETWTIQPASSPNTNLWRRNLRSRGRCAVSLRTMSMKRSAPSTSPGGITASSSLRKSTRRRSKFSPTCSKPATSMSPCTRNLSRTSATRADSSPLSIQ
eukprot:Amastigsp_a882280_3.p3 type:complete len:100 gc:universal Amastigsp_a882280_3:319-20(-)